MNRFFVPFHMQDSGWVLLVLCASIGVWLKGWEWGIPLGALTLFSFLLHEVGHMIAARMLWVPVREFGICMGGAYNRRAYATRRRDEILISAAGPAMNLLLAVPMLFVPGIGTQLALGNLALGVVNLLPLPGSDGMRILRALCLSAAPGPAPSRLRASSHPAL